MTDSIDPEVSRRNFLVKSGILIGASCLFGAACSGGPERQTQAEEVPPTEDLMREHGILRRVMLIYDEIGRRLNQGEEFPLQLLPDANSIIRRFVQDYHEKNEESHLFNRFSNAGKLAELVAILYQQHLAGRRLIGKIKVVSKEDNLKVAELLHTFNQLFRHHAAWEDTVLFPAFRSIISTKDFAQMGETFEREEEKLFGQNGYEKIVGEVAELEKKLAIYDLQQFTPKF